MSSKIHKEKTIHTSYSSFIMNMEGLRLFIRNLTPTAKKSDESLLKSIADFSQDLYNLVGIDMEEIKSTKPKSLRKKRIREALSSLNKTKIQELFQFLVQRLSAFQRQPTITQISLLYKSAFVMLVSYFDFLLSDIFYAYYRTYPKSLESREAIISLTDLTFCENIDDATSFILSKEVENLLYQSLNKRKNHLTNFMKVDTQDRFISWGRLNEIVERRNLVVHNNDIINKRYLDNVDLKYAPEKLIKLKKGNSLSITDKYFQSAFDEVFITGIILFQSCWRKWYKKDLKEADSYLSDTIYNELLAERWSISERLCEFAKECEVSDINYQLIFRVNYCQSLKWQNKNKKLKDEISDFDVSALRPKFTLALAALKGDRSLFYNNVEKAVISDGLDKESFMEWPLFRELRNDPTYETRIDNALQAAKVQGVDNDKTT